MTPERPSPKLYLFDLDGTLVQYKTWNVLANVKETLHALPKDATLAICSNQGGVGLRWWMIFDGFGNPSQYPSEAHIRDKVAMLLSELDIRLYPYYCFAYQSQKSGKWNPDIDADDTGDIRFWQHDWRKPFPGMLLQAMNDFNVTPEETLMVGDWPEDELAAAAAGCAFQWDYEFFKRPKATE